jgi:hypothetical protein
MSTSKLTDKPRLARFAALGALVSLCFAAVGHRLDAAVPAIPLDHQLLYNWATLLLSPASFLLRVGDPDGAIVPSLSFVIVAAACNASWYALLFWSLPALRNTLRLPVDSTSSLANSLKPSAALGGAPCSSRRFSPAERLAERYEHRLSSEHTDSPELEASVLSGTER